jgi:hypothetical protein
MRARRISLVVIVMLTAGALSMATARPASSQAASAAMAGTWEGAITLPQLTLQIRVVLRETAGALSGTIDIPQQGATALALRAVSRDGPAVRFELPTAGPAAMFDGELRDGRIAGRFTQGPAKGTFALSRAAATPEPVRAPVPYRDEELAVEGGDARLAGTLTLPPGAGPFPAVVLLGGSGARPRDGDVFGFKVQGVMADALTRQGIAVYRFDDRGTGSTTGAAAHMTTELFAVDALAALTALQRRPDIDSRRVGFVGHSEGATVAAIAAARSAEVAYVVMLAGPGVRGDLVLRQQAVDVARSIGASDEAVARIGAAHAAAAGAARDNAPAEVMTARVRDLVGAQIDAMPPAQRRAMGDRAKVVEQGVQLGMRQFGSPWMRFMLDFDPATALRQVKVPALAIFGGLDVQVAPVLNQRPVADALGSNPRATVKVYPEANHLFQRARTGLVSEYATLEKAFVPGLMDEIGAWITSAGN